MLKRTLSLMVAVAALALPRPSLAQRPQMLGNIEPGPHAVGFRTMNVTDPSRTSGPKQTDEKAKPEDRARRLVLHVWYPATAADGPAGGSGDKSPDEKMTIGDYIRASDGIGQPAGSFATEHRQTFPRVFGFAPADDEWTKYNALALAARRDAQPATGRFPLLVGTLRAVSVVAMSEYLASHGYVVAFVQSPRDQIDAEGLVLEALVMGQHVRDMEIATATMRREAFVHPAQLGALGISGAGLAQLVMTMRSTDVEAISQLETGYFAPIGTSSYQEVTAYEPTVLRTPFFFAHSETLGRTADLQMAEIEKMRYAPRYLLYLGETRMNHLDFGTEGIAVLATMTRRDDAKKGVLRAYDAIQRYQLAFFDAFVKRDAAAKTRLTTQPPPSGGPMIEITEQPAIVPAVSRREFRGLLGSNTAKALQLAREGLARDPNAAVFDETWLNALGYELLQTGQQDRALGDIPSERGGPQDVHQRSRLAVRGPRRRRPACRRARRCGISFETTGQRYHGSRRSAKAARRGIEGADCEGEIVAIGGSARGFKRGFTTRVHTGVHTTGTQGVTTSLRWALTTGPRRWTRVLNPRPATRSS